MKTVVLDAGALIAVERGNRAVQALLERIVARQARILVPAGVVGEVWRSGTRQARLARLLGATETEVVALTHGRARAAGALMGMAGTHDVVDASVVVCAVEHGPDTAIVTGDPEDLRDLAAGNVAIVPI